MARQLDIAVIAEACHEANRVLQRSNNERFVSPRWTYAPEHQKSSAISGVRAALEGKSPEELHEAWCAVKHAEGWIYGEEKNETTRTHPCLVPYSELPRQERLKDHVFHNIVAAFVEHNKE